MLRTLLAIFRLLRPLTSLAREVSIIRELYELELAARENPITRVTQRPRKDDTEVSYGLIDPRKKHKMGFEPDDDEEDEPEPEEVPILKGWQR